MKSESKTHEMGGHLARTDQTVRVRTITDGMSRYGKSTCGRTTDKTDRNGTSRYGMSRGL